MSVVIRALSVCTLLALDVASLEHISRSATFIMCLRGCASNVWLLACEMRQAMISHILQLCFVYTCYIYIYVYVSHIYIYVYVRRVRHDAMKIPSLRIATRMILASIVRSICE